jgi:hypothetical protein
VTRTQPWFEVVSTMGTPPRSLTAEANSCFMVRVSHGLNRIQGCDAIIAPERGLPSDQLYRTSNNEGIELQEKNMADVFVRLAMSFVRRAIGVRTMTIQLGKFLKLLGVAICSRSTAIELHDGFLRIRDPLP